MNFMTKLGVACVFSVVGLVAAGCGEPTLEEACESYCDAAQVADCGDLPAECAGGCGLLEDALEDVGYGSCLDQYTQLLDCAADGSFQCVDGFTVASGEGCSSEALDLAQCIDDAQPAPG
jgi:hypothetical protein